MPAVPKVAGVPLLVSYSIATTALLVSDLITTIFGTAATRWGIYFEGFPVLAADNTINFEYKQDFQISDYPTEDGGFQSYNKVQLPSDIRMRFSRGGGEADRREFLESIDAVMNTVDLYDVLTPEQIYSNYNFSHRDFTRSAKNGVGLITVDIWLREIRLSATSTFTNTQVPGVAGRAGVGAVQPRAPDDKITQSFTSGSYVVA